MDLRDEKLELNSNNLREIELILNMYMEQVGVVKILFIEQQATVPIEGVSKIEIRKYLDLNFKMNLIKKDSSINEKDEQIYCIKGIDFKYDIKIVDKSTDGVEIRFKRLK